VAESRDLLDALAHPGFEAGDGEQLALQDEYLHRSFCADDHLAAAKAIFKRGRGL